MFRSSDIWAFGCILYQFLVGRPPFRGATDYLTFQKILKKEMDFPDGFDEDARALVELVSVSMIGGSPTSIDSSSILIRLNVLLLARSSRIPSSPPSTSPHYGPRQLPSCLQVSPSLSPRSPLLILSPTSGQSSRTRYLTEGSNMMTRRTRSRPTTEDHHNLIVMQRQMLSGNSSRTATTPWHRPVLHSPIHRSRELEGGRAGVKVAGRARARAGIGRPLLVCSRRWG